MAELRPGQEFAGHRIERMAGRGGMGIVYAATDLRLKRTVALKVIAPSLAAEPDFQQRFERECELAAQVDHPGVVAVYSAGEEDGFAYVTMRWIEGNDLAELIRERGRLPAPMVKAIAVQLGEALEAAHARGLVHRDVKPANVLVREERGRSARLPHRLRAHSRAELRHPADVDGRRDRDLDYMAPEQLADAPLDQRTDVYALGCVLYEALTGSVPFPTEGAPAKLYAHTNADRPSLLELVPDLPPALDRVIRKSMAKAPEDRFQSAADLGMAAAAAIEGAGAGPRDRDRRHRGDGARRDRDGAGGDRRGRDLGRRAGRGGNLPGPAGHPSPASGAPRGAARLGRARSAPAARRRRRRARGRDPPHGGGRRVRRSRRGLGRRRRRAARRTPGPPGGGDARETARARRRWRG